MKIAFILAHPDDEAYGPAGTIAKLAKDHEVYVYSLCNGARPGNEAVSDQRVRGFLKSCELLGVKRVIHDRPDLSLTYPEAVQAVENIIRQTSPEVVYTHNISDVNRDHKIVAEACIVACRPKPTSTVRAFYMIETPASTDWAFDAIEPVFSPNVYVDITDFIELKKRVLALYSTETYDFPDARSIESVVTRAKYRGSQVGIAYAEAFKLIYSHDRP